MQSYRRPLQWPLVTCLAFILFLSSGCATCFDRFINGTRVKPPYDPDPAAAELHSRLLIIDLHADPLLWDRDLLTRSSYGHVDLPRLRDGNVGIEVFGVVTGVPFPPSLDNNRDGWDSITMLAWLEGWPREARKSRLERALYQSAKLQGRISASAGALMLIKNRRDLESLVDARLRGVPVIGALLSLEGVHALEGDPENIDRLFDAGFRMLGLVHLFDNDMAGSAHGKEKHGLTDKGKDLVRRALARGMIIDLAHASPKTIDDVVAMASAPVIASHGGVRGTCDTTRNLADQHVRAIAKTGGVIGIGVYRYATCGKTIEDTVRAMRYAADLVGVEHVALGSDFDGAVTTVVDAGGLALLTGAMRKQGFSAEEIAAIMGGNALRVLRQTLPDE